MYIMYILFKITINASCFYLIFMINITYTHKMSYYCLISLNYSQFIIKGGHCIRITLIELILPLYKYSAGDDLKPSPTHQGHKTIH